MKEEEMRISKELLPSLPEGYEETLLGDPRGSLKQFRNSRVHVREYSGHYTVHVDRVDPRRNALGHLVFDSPETLVSFATGMLAAGSVSTFSRERGGPAVSRWIASFFVTFLVTKGLVRLLRMFFRG